jgi:hypothetical protein
MMNLMMNVLLFFQLLFFWYNFSQLLVIISHIAGKKVILNISSKWMQKLLGKKVILNIIKMT